MRPHSIAYYVGHGCDVCRGCLVITKSLQDGNFFIMCDDCMTERKDPETLEWLPSNFDRIDVKNATLEEIRELGWEKYITGNYVDFECV